MKSARINLNTSPKTYWLWTQVNLHIIYFPMIFTLTIQANSEPFCFGFLYVTFPFKYNLREFEIVPLRKNITNCHSCNARFMMVCLFVLFWFLFCFLYCVLLCFRAYVTLYACIECRIIYALFVLKGPLGLDDVNRLVPKTFLLYRCNWLLNSLELTIVRRTILFWMNLQTGGPTGHNCWSWYINAG